MAASRLLQYYYYRLSLLVGVASGGCKSWSMTCFGLRRLEVAEHVGVASKGRGGLSGWWGSSIWVDKLRVSDKFDNSKIMFNAQRSGYDLAL